jgi:hypothetical protein
VVVVVVVVVLVVEVKYIERPRKMFAEVVGVAGVIGEL